MKTKLRHGEKTFKIIGACFEVYNEKKGFTLRAQDTD